MAEGLRPPRVTEPEAAIGRPLSRMPVIIRSHESSGASMMEDVGRGMECVLQFVQIVDIERNYFSKARFPSCIIDSPSPVSLRETVLSPEGRGERSAAPLRLSPTGRGRFAQQTR